VTEFDALTAARSVVAGLAAHADHGEQAGQLAEASLEALKSSGMLSLWRPLALGGHECDPVRYAAAAEEIATADSAAGWMMHGVSAMWFDLRLADASFIAEIVEVEVPVFAESFNKPQQATRVEGGYRLNGATPFASNCRSADWIGHTAVADGRMLIVYHPRGALEIQDDWHSLGMRGTSSNTVVSHDAFVPQHRTIDLGAGQRHPDFGGALYRMPEGTIPVAVAAVSLGVLRTALDELGEIAENKTPFAASTTLKHRALAQLHFGQALATYRAARSYLHDTLGEAYRRSQAGDAFDLRQKADLILAYAHVLQSCVGAVRRIGKAAGTSAIYRGSPIERAIRDSEVISHHAFGAEGRFASVAQAYWGLDVDFPLLGMD
jgi:alkylation response protein AidB-like acyl-CoA dehydrogenase